MTPREDPLLFLSRLQISPTVEFLSPLATGGRFWFHPGDADQPHIAAPTH
jgi:hypothetical protein